MARLKLYKDNYTAATVVSNHFIDEYMKEANDAQLKVYLYLLRMLGANQAFSVSDIADKFNHTEKDVLRSLRYWEKQGLLTLDYDEDKNLTGIHLRELSAEQPNQEVPVAFVQHRRSDLVTSVAPAPAASPAATVSAPETAAMEEPAFTKPNYSADQLRAFRNNENTAQLLFIAESYVGKPLTPSEIKTILFFTDVLHFSDELIDYLIQYCVDRGKKDFKYIEKVAIRWAEDGVTTPRQAQKQSAKYDKGVYAIMNELGRSGSPTTRELEYINRWMKEYGFTLDIIIEACERTALATDRHRFEYAESILRNWKEADVHRKADILQIDSSHQKRRSGKPNSSGSNQPTGGKFNQFTQNNYDFAALEKELISN